MKKPIALLSAGLMVCSLSFISVGAVSVQAAEQSSAESSKKRVRRSATMRPVIYKKLDGARELADAKKYQDALKELQSLEKRRRNSYETAMTHNMYAYVYFNQEKYKSAAAAYEQVLSVGNIPESLEQTTLYSLSKLYLIQEDYKKALVPLNKWFGIVESANAESFVLRAQIYFQVEQYSKALPDVKKAIAMTKETGKMPRENWLMLERAVYYQNKDFKNLARCLQDLATLYPKSQYWVQLAAVYSELNQPKKELATLETAFEQGMLTKESELVNYAQALLGQDIPYKAASILTSGMEKGVIKESARSLSLLGDAWMLAKEYDQAIGVMTKAADLSHKGSDYFKLAQIHTERQEWNLALSNVKLAIAQGDLTQPHSALILQGLILFNLDELTAAKGTFVKARGYDAATKTADQWIKYIEDEEQRRAYMAASS
ncbi:tetratricopeptide repeat protein [Oceanobacter sp. 4_MG-2023]|uniref:tetratricopeptide repeat protein n=2 Tax=Gammaproteobacteria TaxID=1236 RepID=UPI002732BE06|nr:tetratricopeptide repeat protein [Oceanobacter sp. 4_MG-2023]MDP2547877.1 tetratricopeptide repeat protein [Oceanobacter sp. 4_MG-2023]